MSVRDYESLKTEYLVSEKRIADIAREHDLPRGTVNRIAYEQSWTAERDKLRVQTNQVKLEAAVQAAVDEVETASAIIRRGIKDIESGKTRVRASDIIDALKFLVVQRGGVDGRTETRSLSVTAAIGDLAAAAGVDVSDVRRRLIAELSAAESAVDSVREADSGVGEADEAAQPSRDVDIT